MAKRNPQQTKERILMAATDAFSSQGLGGARVGAIAKRAGINKCMKCRYFGSKDQLFLQALESVYAQIRLHERALRHDDLDPEAGLQEAIEERRRHVIEFILGNSRPQGNGGA